MKRRLFNEFRLCSSYFENFENDGFFSTGEFEIIERFYNNDEFTDDETLFLLNILHKFDYINFIDIATLLIFKSQLNSLKPYNFPDIDQGIFLLKNEEDFMFFSFQKNYINSCRFIMQENQLLVLKNSDELILETIKNNNLELFQELFNFNKNYNIKKLFTLTCKYSQLEIAKLLINDVYNCVNLEVSDLNFAKWLFNYNNWFVKNSLKLAFKNEDLEFIIWIFEVIGDQINDYDIMNTLVCGDNLECFQFVFSKLKRILPISYTNELITKSCENGLFNIVNFMKDRISERIIKLCVDIACKNNHLEIAKFLYYNHTIENIFPTDNPELLRWILSLKFSEDFKLTSELIIQMINRNLECAKILHEKFQFSLDRYHNQIFNVAIQNDDANSLIWLYNNVKLNKIRSKFNLACSLCKIECAKFFYCQNCDFSESIIDVFYEKKSIQFIDWIESLNISNELTEQRLTLISHNLTFAKWIISRYQLTIEQKNIIFNQACKSFNHTLAKIIYNSDEINISNEIFEFVIRNEMTCFAKWLKNKNPNLEVSRDCMFKLCNSMVKWVYENRMANI